MLTHEEGVDGGEGDVLINADITCWGGKGETEESFGVMSMLCAGLFVCDQIQSKMDQLVTK